MSLSNSMVAHKWAHGEAGKSGNMTTDGKRLISYSTDIGYNTGRGLVFISSDNMSPSTGKQLYYARRAVSHLDVVYTPIFSYGSRFYDFDENEAFKMACSALNDTLDGFSKARLGKYLYNSMVQANEKKIELASIGIRYSLDLIEFFVVPPEKLEAARLYAEQYAVNQAEREEKARVKAHAAAAAQRELQSSQFELWHNGGQGSCPFSYRHDASGGYYIAVRHDKVVTSGGAECPIEHARRAIKFWKTKLFLYSACDGRGGVMGSYAPWRRNGERVQLGTFQLDRIESDGTAYAGCHKFSVAELNRLADILL